MAGRRPEAEVICLRDQPCPSRQISVLMAVEDHWRSLARPDDIPDRRDVDPARIGPMLRHCYMASIVAPGLARLRFAGQDVSATFGMDVRGMPLSALFEAGSRLRVSEAVTRVCDGPEIVELPLVSPQGMLRRTVPGRMSLLPLRDETGAVSHILGAVIFDGKAIGEAPGRIAIPSDRAFRLEALQAPMSPPAPQGRPKLRLVVDNG